MVGGGAIGRGTIGPGKSEIAGAASPATRPLLWAAASIASAWWKWQSAFRWKRVVSVAVPLSDSSLSVVGEEFRAIVDCNLAPGSNGLSLGLVDGRNSLVARTLDRPAVRVGNHMLVLFRHGFAFHESG